MFVGAVIAKVFKPKGEKEYNEKRKYFLLGKAYFAYYDKSFLGNIHFKISKFCIFPMMLGESPRIPRMSHKFL